MHCFDCDVHFPLDSKVCSICGRQLDTDSDRYFKAGMEAMAIGELDRAVEYLYDCVGLDPRHISGRYNLGMSLSLSDRCDEAMGHYCNIAQDNPEYPGLYTAMGQAAFGSYLTHYSEAEAQRSAMIRYFMAAIEQDPHDVDAYFSLGNAYMAMENAEKAITWLETALRLHPESPAINYMLAKALKMTGNEPEAAVMAQKSLQLSNPSDPFWPDIHELCMELNQTMLQM